MFISFRRIIKAGWLNFSRNSGLSIAVVFIMVIAISLVTFIFFLRQMSQFLILDIQARADISVYFKPIISGDEILKIKDEINKLPETKEVRYISQIEALEKFKERHQDNPGIMGALEILGYNPFLSSLSIRAWEAGQYTQIVNFLEASPFGGMIKEIDYHQRELLIERIFLITSEINRMGIILSLVLILVVVLFSYNVTKLAIYAQKEEIAIQKLIGASSWFIRGPFIVQGIIIGIFSALIVFLIFMAAAFLLEPGLEVLLPGFYLFDFFINTMLIIFSIQLIIGVGLGVFSSVFAVRKYLKI